MENVTLKETLMIIKRGAKVIIFITALATLITAGVNYYVIPPTYEAATSLIIGQGNEPNDGRMQYDTIMMYQKLIRTYMEIAKSQQVLFKMTEKLGRTLSLQKIQERVSVTTLEGTQILILKAQSSDPGEAFTMATALTESFIEESQRVYPIAKIQILDPAEKPIRSLQTAKIINVISAFLLGLIAALWLTFVRDSMNKTIRTFHELEVGLQIPVIGIIPWEG